MRNMVHLLKQWLHEHDITPDNLSITIHADPRTLSRIESAFKAQLDNTQGDEVRPSELRVLGITVRLRS